MDGTDRSVLVKDDLGLPNGLTFDHEGQQLCWADAGETNLSPPPSSDPSPRCCRRSSCHVTLPPADWLLIVWWLDGPAGTRKVECVDPHRGLRRLIVEGIQYPFALVHLGKNLYYTDWRR